MEIFMKNIDFLHCSSILEGHRCNNLRMIGVWSGRAFHAVGD